MVNNLVFRWPKPLFFHGFLRAHGFQKPLGSFGYKNKTPWQRCSRKARKVQGLGVKTARSNRPAWQNVANFRGLAAHGNSPPPDPWEALEWVPPQAVGGWCEMEVPEALLFFFARSRVTQQTGKLFAKEQHVFFAKRIVCWKPKVAWRLLFFVHSCHCCQYFEQWTAATCTTCRTTTQWRAWFYFGQFSNSKSSSKTRETSNMSPSDCMERLQASHLTTGRGFVKWIKICSVHFLKCAPSHTPVRDVQVYMFNLDSMWHYRCPLIYGGRTPDSFHLPLLLRGYVSRGRVQRPTLEHKLPRRHRISLPMCAWPVACRLPGLFEGFELLEKGTIKQAGVANFLRD